MTRDEMLTEINAILNDSRKKALVDGIIPLLHGKWELQIMLEVCRADVLRFGDYKRRLPPYHQQRTDLRPAQSGKMGSGVQSPVQ